MNERQLALGVLFVSPDFVAPQVCRVKISFCGIEYHAVDSCLGTVLVILDAFLERSFLIHCEDVPETSVVIERVAVHVERWLLCCQDEDCSCVRVWT